MIGGPKGFCPCPLEGAMEVMGSKWAISIIVTIGNYGKARFTELQKYLGRIAPRTLAIRLKELEDTGLIKRESFNEIPPRVEYSLTKDGGKVREMLRPLVEWTASR